MTTTRRTARLARASALAATGALALGLLPLAAASAGPASPQVSFISASGLTSSTGNTAGDAVTITPITPAGYRTFGLDVSADGNTALLALCRGTYSTAPTATATSECTDRPSGTSYDATFGLVLVHRDSTGGVVRARVLATQWDANAVLTTNGATTTAWFLLDGVLYKYDVNEAAGLWDASAGAVTVADNTHFTPLATATSAAVGLAVTSDGTTAATMWRSATAYTAGKIRVATLGAGTSFAWSLDAGAAAVQPNPSTFAFQGSTLVYGKSTFAASGTPSNLTVKLQGAAPSGEVAVPGLNGFYSLRPDAGGNWWGWTDVADGSNTASFLGGITDTTTYSGTPLFHRADGLTTFGFVESSVAPPSLADVAPGSPVDPAILSVPAAHTTVLLTPTVIPSKGVAAFFASNYYWAALPNKPYSTAVAAEVDKGRLQWSFDGVNWSSGVPTSGAHAFGIGTTYYTGHTPKMTRNAFFRWVYPGDLLTGRGVSASKVLAVRPAVTKVGVLPVAGRRHIYGAIQQTSGRIALRRLVGRTWQTLATVKISGTGLFDFGTRALPHGTYLLQTLNGTTTGAGWATATKQFSF